MIANRKIGFFCNGNLLDMPLEEMCRAIKRIGYDTIELPMWAFHPDEGVEELRKKLNCIQENGLELSEVVVQQDYINRDPDDNQHSIEMTKRCIETYAEIGVKTLNLFTGPRPWIPNPVIVGRDITEKQAWETLFAAFDVLVPVAEKFGINLAVESVWSNLCHDFYTTQYLLNHYRSEALGVNLDPSHDRIFGNSDMEFLVTGYGDAIKHIHLKDAVGAMGKNLRGEVQFIFPVLGEGLVDWAGFKKGLDAIGYEGVMSVEYEADGYLSHYLDGDMLRAAEETYKIIEKMFA